MIVINSLVVSKCEGQSISFNKTYDNNVDILFNIHTVDSGYYFVMLSGYPIFPLYSYFTTIDNYGDTLNQVEFGSDSDYFLTYSIIDKNDSVKIFGGHCYNDTLNKTMIKLMFVKNTGDSISTSNYIDPDSGSVYISNLICTSGGGILATGQYEDSLNTDGSILIIKLDSTGNFLWKSIFGGIRYDSGFTSIETPDKGFLTLGWTRSFGFGNSSNRDIILVKWDSLGNKVWHKTYGGPNMDSGFGITATSDGNYLLACGRYGNTDIQSWLAKVDGNGNLIWNRFYGTRSEIWWAKERFDGSIVSVGADRTSQYDNGYIVKTDSLGTKVWDRHFNLNNNHSYFRDFDFTLDGGYICAGFTFTGASGNQDAWLVKLDSLGCDSLGCASYVGLFENANVHQEEVKLWPNPAIDAITISFDYTYAGFLSWNLYNTEGKIIKTGKEFFQKSFMVNTNELPPGIYLLQLETDGGRITKKFIKQ